MFLCGTMLHAALAAQDTLPVNPVKPQNTDTVVGGSAVNTPDSGAAAAYKDTGLEKAVLTDSSVIIAKKPLPNLLDSFYKANSYVNTHGPIIYRVERQFEPPAYDALFYVAITLLLVLGIIRLIFWKYFSDLFRIFFQTTFRQKSIREQLLQNKTASLFLNGFFCVSAGLFLYQLAVYKGWLNPQPSLRIALIGAGIVGAVYGVKYVGLQLSGFLLGMAEVADAYTFIVFLLNKVIGVLLLPASIILALGVPEAKPVVVTIALLGVACLFLYRYFIAMPLVRNQMRLSGFHFFIYLCAFEIVPVLLIYRAVLDFVGEK